MTGLDRSPRRERLVGQWYRQVVQRSVGRRTALRGRRETQRLLLLFREIKPKNGGQCGRDFQHQAVIRKGGRQFASLDQTYVARGKVILGIPATLQELDRQRMPIARRPSREVGPVSVLDGLLRGRQSFAHWNHRRWGWWWRGRWWRRWRGSQRLGVGRGYYGGIRDLFVLGRVVLDLVVLGRAVLDLVVLGRVKLLRFGLYRFRLRQRRRLHPGLRRRVQRLLDDLGVRLLLLDLDHARCVVEALRHEERRGRPDRQQQGQARHQPALAAAAPLVAISASHFRRLPFRFHQLLQVGRLVQRLGGGVGQHVRQLADLRVRVPLQFGEDRRAVGVGEIGLLEEQVVAVVEASATGRARRPSGPSRPCRSPGARSDPPRCCRCARGAVADAGSWDGRLRWSSSSSRAGTHMPS